MKITIIILIISAIFFVLAVNDANNPPDETYLER